MTEPEDNPEEAAPEAPPEAKEPPKPAKKPLPAWVGIIMVAGFLVLLLGVGYVIWLGVNTYRLAHPESAFGSGGRVVDKKTYEDAFGWGSELMIDKKPGKPARIRFLLRDPARKPITDAVVEILMVRPDDSSTPAASSELKMNEPGVYRGDVDMPGGGLWEARIRVKQAGNAYQITRQVTIPETEEEAAPEEKPEDGKNAK